MWRTIWIGSFIAAIVSPLCNQAFSFAPTKEVVLPKAEARKVEELACTKQKGIGAKTITAYQYSEPHTPQAFHYAYVQCKPHGEFSGSAIHFASNCDFANKKWICDEAELHIAVTINSRTVDVVPGPLKPEQAEYILKKISTYGGFRGRSIDKGIGDHCSIHSSSDPEELDLMCSDGITISFWCPQPEITHCPRILSMDLIIND